MKRRHFFKTLIGLPAGVAAATKAGPLVKAAVSPGPVKAQALSVAWAREDLTDLIFKYDVAGDLTSHITTNPEDWEVRDD